ncbi:MAG: hypothetical protein H7831_13745 [Magnetococcus sp. WYHC-3]
MRHNKKRNSIFLYEVLVRELTKTIVEGNEVKKNKIISIIKSSFRRGTLIYEEWRAYKALLGVKTNKQLAEKLVAEVSKDYDHIDKTALFDEQSKLIKKINSNFPSSIYSNFVPNYRSMATVYQIFNGGRSLPVMKRIMLEEQLVNEMSEIDPVNTVEFQQTSKLAFKTFMDRFNITYSTLLREQRELLQKYVLGGENDVEFKVYLGEEIERLRNVVKGSLLLKEVKEDAEMVNKTNSVLEVLNSFKTKPVDQSMIEQILKVQQLAEEITENGN